MGLNIVTLFLRTIFKLTKYKYEIIILETSFPSGSNTKILYDEMIAHRKNVLYLDTRSKNLPKLLLLKKIVYDYYLISKSKIIVSTHGFQKIKNSQMSINLWHGIPMKSMNYMHLNSKKIKFKDDILITNSKIDSTLLSSCMQISFEKHKIIGSPRIDYLTHPNLSRGVISDFKKFDKVIIYLPTFRKGMYHVDGNLTGLLFNFDKLSSEELEKFLVVNNYLLLIKLHPSEISTLKIDYSKLTNIKFILDEELAQDNVDLYEILPHTDLLITDYSSVYFDYLHLNRPIIFLPTDLEEYSESRGLLLEPYSFWTPGPKVTTQDDLFPEIKKQLASDTHYGERVKFKNLFFKKNEQLITESVIKFISELIK